MKAKRVDRGAGVGVASEPRKAALYTSKVTTGAPTAHLVDHWWDGTGQARTVCGVLLDAPGDSAQYRRWTIPAESMLPGRVLCKSCERMKDAGSVRGAGGAS
jgi:hypothetical protein